MSSTTNTVYTTGSLINMLASEPSICVPRIYMNITKERVHDVFADLFGHQAIERVDMIERENKEGEPYKRAFVHFKFWPRTEQSTEVRLKLLNGEEVKVVYDQPWYWRISASRLPRPEQQQRRKDAVPSRPFIMIEDDVPQRREQRPLQARDIAPYQDAPRGYEQRDRRDDRRDDRRAPRHYEQRPLQTRDVCSYQDAPRGYERERRPHYDDRREREHREPRQQYPREHYQQRRTDERRPAPIRTPTKEPEIASWVGKSAPGAPGPKGRKPRLVIEEEGGAGATEAKSSASTRPRRLSFDETTDDESASVMAGAAEYMAQSMGGNATEHLEDDLRAEKKDGDKKQQQ